MDIYKKLNLNVASGKEQPGVWVGRLMLFEKLYPEPVVIREVKLSRGLNIVWAQEPDDDNTTTEIKGHSAGKTSFCRLLRYVLGEKAFGTKANQKLIQNALPDGYVGAELHVLGKPWAVIRPFDTARRSYVRAEASIEALVADRRGALGHEEYVNQLGLAKLLDPIETATVVRSAQSIEWDHVLAWCTRDQEARFQNIHEWRSTRSESEWPAFKASKADALFVMRTVLGLFLSEELKLEEELAAKVRLKESLETKVAELEREPQFRVNLYTQVLKEKLSTAYPERSDINALPLRWDQLTPDLARLTEDAARRLMDEIRTAERQQTDLQAQIDEMGADIAWWERENRMLHAFSGIADAGAAEVRAGLGEAQKLRDDLAHHGHTTCPFGGVIINKCDYVVDRLNRLSIPHLRDAQALEQAEAARGQDRRVAEEQQTNVDQQLLDLRRRREKSLLRRNELAERISEVRHAYQELVKHSRPSTGGWPSRAKSADSRSLMTRGRGCARLERK